MGSYMNFKNYDDTTQTDGSCWNPPTSSTPLVRQSSIYSLTFDEFQTTLGGSVKEFGSMNMEEFLKNIWTAEENQSLATSVLREDGNSFSGNLQRQCSLTLPRTLSQKTVEQVWRDVLKETTGGQDANTSSIANLLPREPTLGDMTLEDFLAKAGVVREEIQMSDNTVRNNAPLQNDNSAYVTLDFRQPSKNDVSLGHEPSHRDNMFLGPPNLGVIPGGVCFTGAISQQPVLPKQTTLSFSSPQLLGNNGHFASGRMKGSDIGMSHSNNTSVQGEPIGIGVGNHFHRDVVVKSKLDSPPLSPSPSSSPLPNAFGGVGARGRRSIASMEKAVERRRKRMIKNRESAARSRARKQAYTLELEAEIAMLKDKNHELRKKQEILEMQKNQMLEAMKLPRESTKRRCLRRTSTGSW